MPHIGPEWESPSDNNAGWAKTVERLNERNAELEKELAAAKDSITSFGRLWTAAEADRRPRVVETPPESAVEAAAIELARWTAGSKHKSGSSSWWYVCRAGEIISEHDSRSAMLADLCRRSARAAIIASQKEAAREPPVREPVRTADDPE